MKLRNLQRIIKSTGQRYLLSMNEAVSVLNKILLRERSKGWWWTLNVQGHIRDIPATISRNCPEKDTILVVGWWTTTRPSSVSLITSFFYTCILEVGIRGLTLASKISLAEVSCSQIYKATMKTTYLMKHIFATKMNLQVNLRGKPHCTRKS